MRILIISVTREREEKEGDGEEMGGRYDDSLGWRRLSRNILIGCEMKNVRVGIGTAQGFQAFGARRAEIT